MLACLAFCESADTWNPIPQLLSLALYTISTGAIGMLFARRRPIVSAPFIFCVLLSAFAVYLELRDSYFGPSILRAAAYILGSTVAVLAGIGMAVLGALVGAKKMDERLEAWRWTSGGSGIAILGLTLFAVSDFARTAYHEYFIHQKYAKNNNLPLMSWQDVLPGVFIACVLIGLLVLAAYLLRSAFRPTTPTSIPANS
jgi:hypothetical protein